MHRNSVSSSVPLSANSEVKNSTLGLDSGFNSGDGTANESSNSTNSLAVSTYHLSTISAVAGVGVIGNNRKVFFYYIHLNF